jgi:hypothetical protein
MLIESRDDNFLGPGDYSYESWMILTGFDRVGVVDDDKKDSRC